TLTKIVSQRPDIRREANPVAVAAALCGVQTCLQTGTRRAAHRLTGERVIDVRARLCHAVKIRRQIKRVAVHASCIPSLLVGKEHDHIWGFHQQLPLWRTLVSSGDYSSGHL